jgi:hypothetical protein
VIIYFQCDELPVSEKVALQLAGLQAQVSLGEPQPGRPELYSDVDAFLPARIKRARFLSDSEWVPILAEAHHHYGSGKAEVVAKVWYLSCIMQYPLYGCTLFPATYRGYWSHGNYGRNCEYLDRVINNDHIFSGNAIILGVNAEGLIVVKPEDKSILMEFPYTEVESLLLDPSDDFVTLNLRADGVTGRQRVHVFETARKAAVGSLVAAYCPALANWIREADAPRRRVKQVTNEDRLRLHQALVTSRRALVDSGLLRRPADGDQSSGFLRSTLRRLSSKKASDRYRAEALANEQSETYKGFGHSYWAFARSPLTQTLSSMPGGGEADESQALDVFQLILTYAGLQQRQHETKGMSG